MDYRPALLFALIAQLSFPYLAMSGDNRASGTAFSSVAEGVNYAAVPAGLANVKVLDRAGNPLDFHVADNRLYFTGGYANVSGSYPAWVCDYSYMPRALRGADSDSFLIDVCSSGRPVFIDEFTFTGLPADRRLSGIVYYPYYAYSGEDNVTRLASAEEPLYFDVLNYTYSGGVLRIGQRLLVNPSNWSNVFLLVFEDYPSARPGGGAGPAVNGTGSSVGGMLLPLIALLVSIPIALVAWSRHVCR
jgi:hypothetical protein